MMKLAQCGRIRRVAEATKEAVMNANILTGALQSTSKGIS